MALLLVELRERVLLGERRGADKRWYPAIFTPLC